MLLRRPLLWRPRARALPAPFSSSAAPPRFDTALVLFGGLTTLASCLCAWQLSRYGWKVDLLAERARSLSAAPMDVSEGPLPAPLLDTAATPNTLSPVVIHGGSLEPARAALLSPRVAPKSAPAWLTALSRANAGHQVVMPLRRRDGTRVLAIVGWLPSDAEAPAAWAAAGAPLAGVLRGSDAGAGGAWDSAPAPAAAPAAPAGPQLPPLRELPTFSFINVPALCAACGLSGERGDVVGGVVEVLAPFPLRGGAAGPWPITRQWEDLNTAYATPATHLSYAATWCMLAAYGGFSTYVRWRRGRGAPGSRRR